jgi:uncharacterized damage-inducible protein DinB
MSTLELLRTLIDYHHVLYHRVWDSVMQISNEQFVQDVGYSHGSIRNQMIHVAATDARWLRGLRELPDARQFDLAAADYATREQAREVWEATADEVRAYVASLNDTELERLARSGRCWPIW